MENSKQFALHSFTITFERWADHCSQETAVAQHFIC